MKIQDLQSDQSDRIQQAAVLLLDGFQDWPSGWKTLESALEEVHESLADARLSRVALDAAGQVIGWIGAIQINPYLWELHPLVVKERYRGQGIGRSLVQDLEQQVALRGGVTLWLGTDDDHDCTSLFGTDVYPNVLEHLMQLNAHREHPCAFYRKMGFSVVGVLPDANGWGRPDILMAKRMTPKA